MLQQPRQAQHRSEAAIRALTATVKFQMNARQKSMMAALAGFLVVSFGDIISSRPLYASSAATLFRFRSFMPAQGNCEGAAWQPGQNLGDRAYASWDARKGTIWIGLEGKVYQSKFQRIEAGRLKVVEADFGNIHAIISIPQQAIYNPDSNQMGTLELLSNSSNHSLGKIDVSVGEAC